MKVRKQLALLLAGAMAVGSLTGCGGNANTGSAAKSGGTITVLTHRTEMDAVFKTYKEEFESKHPGTTVNFESVTDYQNNLNTRMSTEDYGDVLMNPGNITKNQFKDFYEPIGNVDELKDKYAFLDNFNVDGTIYALSTGANAFGMIYNEQVLKDAGITKLPTSPEEFQAMLKAIKEKTSATPLYTNYVADWALTNWCNALQTGISGDVDYMNKFMYNKHEFEQGSATYTSLKMLYDSVANKYVEQDPMTSDWEYSKQALADGKIGVMCLGSWAIGQIKAVAKNPENIKFMGAPVSHNGKQYIQLATDFGMAVNIHSKNKELAKEFVKYFVEKYPNDSNMVSSIVGAKLPEYLSGLSNTELIQQKMGTTQSATDQDAIQKASLININDGKWVKTIVEIGLGNGKQTFDEYMASLNKSWTSGIDSIGK